MAGHGRAGQGRAWHGGAWQGMAGHGGAGHGGAWFVYSTCWDVRTEIQKKWLRISKNAK